MSSGQHRITGYGVGAPKITLNPPPIISTRAPATTDTRYPLGQSWVNKSTSTAYQLVSVAAGSATWVLLGSSSGAVDSVLGTANQITVSTAGNVATASLPAAITAPGSLTTTTTLAAGTTLTAGTGLTVTTGNATVATGNITSTLGSVTAGTTVTAGTGLSVTTGNATVAAGNIAATLGSVSAGTSVTAGTTLTATLGAITATNGNVVLGTAGNKILSTSVGTTSAAGANSFGSVALSGGTVTVSTTSVTTNSLIQIWRQSIGATGAAALGMLTVGTIVNATSFVINAVQAADATALQASDVSVIGWTIIN
jgi:hypothetical protein